MTLDARPASHSPLLGLAALGQLSFAGVDLAPLGEQLIARVRDNPKDADALMDFSTLAQIRLHPEMAMVMQAEALKIKTLYRIDPAGPTRIRLLALMAPGDLSVNAPLDFLLEGSDVALEMLYLLPGQPFPEDFPAHDVLYVAAGASDQTLELLQELENHLSAWPQAVLNAPSRIAWTTRDGACEKLASLPGILMPLSARVEREALLRVAEGGLPVTTLLADGDFPLIVRPLDSHAGRGLAKVDTPAALFDYLENRPESVFYISRFVDYSGPDGQFRKYRVVLVAGRPFAGHMGISEHWMIHYLNAGMTECSKKRAEEERFMATFESHFAKKHATALNGITEALGLDYLVIDCAETRKGQLLIFEVDTGAVIHSMDSPELFPYKRPHMDKVFEAFRAMLANAISRRATQP